MNELSKLLDDLKTYLERFVVFANEHQAVAVTLWIPMTYVSEQLQTTIYLHVSSPEKQSGKSRVLELLELLCLRAWRVIQPSEAVVFRKLERDRPTLLLDEVDALYKGKSARDHEGLRAILNAGHRHGAKVARCDERGGIHEFEVSGPKGLAGIGNLPDTVADRSIPILLKRKHRGEAVEPFRIRDVKPECINLRERLEAWADSADVQDIRPELPEALGDRTQDGWEPLLAIADLAGGEFPAIAREAAVFLHVTERDDDTEAVGIQLLSDLRDLFDDEEALFTERMLEGLWALEGRPWGEFKNGKALTAHGMARLLRPYKVRPAGTVRVGVDTKKGYWRESFKDAWGRYLPNVCDDVSSRGEGGAGVYRYGGNGDASGGDLFDVDALIEESRAKHGIEEGGSLRISREED